MKTLLTFLVCLLLTSAGSASIVGGRFFPQFEVSLVVPVGKLSATADQFRRTERQAEIYASRETDHVRKAYFQGQQAAYADAVKEVGFSLSKVRRVRGKIGVRSEVIDDLAESFVWKVKWSQLDMDVALDPISRSFNAGRRDAYLFIAERLGVIAQSQG